MKYIILTFLMVIAFKAKSQEDLPSGHDQFMKTHFNNGEVASKMLIYDRVAWVSSDSIQTLSNEELSTYGGQWFCYQDSIGIYHALYGAFDSTYILTAHYLVDSATYEVNRTFEPFDTALAIQYSKAYDLALTRKNEFLGPEDHLKYNHFIFRTDSTIRVHFVPAFQTNGYMIYGAEQHYTLSTEATAIIDTLEYFNGYRGYRAIPNKDITIAFEDLDYNSIGSLFFLMYYDQYFKSISILTKEYITSFIKGKKNEGSWVHIVRTVPKERKKKKKSNP